MSFVVWAPIKNAVVFRYHRVSVKGIVTEDFKWLVNLITSTTAEELPRILIFFNNLNTLTDAYLYTTVTSKLFNKEHPTVAMFTLLTKAERKQQILKELTGELPSQLKVVLCSSSLSMGMNLKCIKYVVHYGPPRSADAFLQETGRASREISSHGHSILLQYPRMTSGRKLDKHMAQYVKAETCLRDILLSKFQAQKPQDQPQCCDVCHPMTTCVVLRLIEESFDASITDTFSDSDSIASIGAVEDLPEL